MVGVHPRKNLWMLEAKKNFRNYDVRKKLDPCKGVTKYLILDSRTTHMFGPFHKSGSKTPTCPPSLNSEITVEYGIAYHST